MKSVLAAIVILFPTLAMAEPSVTLTSSELQTLIGAETAKAIANYIAQTQAKGVYDKLNQAFKPPAAPEQPQNK